MDKNKKIWIPEEDACDECLRCRYFLDDYWECQGQKEPCHEFVLSIYEELKNNIKQY